VADDVLIHTWSIQAENTVLVSVEALAALFAPSRPSCSAVCSPPDHQHSLYTVHAGEHPCPCCNEALRENADVRDLEARCGVDGTGGSVE
jgi:hypothetical protein